jgi:HEAT repeat protein
MSSIEERLGMANSFTRHIVTQAAMSVALLMLLGVVFLTVTAFGREAAPELASYLQSDRLETRRLAVLALSCLGMDAVDAVPMLCDTLNAEEPLMRFWANAALGKIGPVARQATAALQRRLDDHDPNVRWGATAALARIDLAAIREQDGNRLLTDPDPGVRRQAATIRAMIP